jgi:hypothetical protein
LGEKYGQMSYDEFWAFTLLESIEWDLNSYLISTQVQYRNQQMDFAVYWKKNSLDTFAVAVQFFQIWFAAC